ncbi:MAG: HAD-IA family hydrolase [Planctomycetes bacterium]|nr:HAD-IA family hydrolase [Planctomycetota bacterium]
MPVRRVLFDVMGTLVYDPFREVMPEFFGMTFDAMMDAKHPTAWLRFERGEIDGETFLDEFFADGRGFDHAAFLATVHAAYRWLDGMKPLLEALAADFPLGLVSNYPVWSETVDAQLELSQLAPWTFLSWKEGVRKPDDEVWHLLKDRSPEPANEILFVDDQVRNIRAAAQSGFMTHQFTDATELRRDLAGYGWHE